MSSESKDVGQNVAHSRNYKPLSTCVAESADAHVWEIKMWRHGAKTCGGRERGRDGGVEEGRGDGRRKTGIGEQGRQERGVGMEGEGGRGQGGERKCAHPYSCVRGTEREQNLCVVRRLKLWVVGRQRSAPGLCPEKAAHSRISGRGET